MSPKVESDEDKQDLYTRYQRIRQKQFHELHDVPYHERTQEQWDQLRDFFDDLMEEANAQEEKEKDE